MMIEHNASEPPRSEPGTSDAEHEGGVPWKQWWEGRRRYRYNVIALISAAAAVACSYFVVVVHTAPRDMSTAVDNVGAAGFVLLFGLGATLYLGLANLCYMLGPALEIMTPRRWLGVYRRTAYALGCTVAVVLPFLNPLSVWMGFRQGSLH